MFYSLAMEDYTTAFRSNFIIKSTETLFFLWARESRTVLCSDLSDPILPSLLSAVHLVTLDESFASLSLCVSGGWMPC